MDREQLIELVVRKAAGHLRYDRAYPDVGMGMGYNTAVNLAWNDVLQEAARWNSIEALRLTLTSDMRKEVIELLYKIDI